METAKFIIEALVGLAAIVALILNFTGKSKEREIRWGFEPVSKKDYEDAKKARDEEIRLVRAEVEKNREAAEREGKIRAAGIYRKIDEVRTELSANLETARQELSENQRALPNEIVTLLKNTNAI